MPIFVYTETHNGNYKKSAFEAISYAKSIANIKNEEVVAISINGTESSESLYKYGASRVIKISDELLDNFDPSTYAKAINEVISDEIVILSASGDSASIAPLLSIFSNASIVTNIESTPSSLNPFTVSRNSFSGKTIETVAIEGKVILTIIQNSFGLIENPVQGFEEFKQVSIKQSNLNVISKEESYSNNVDLKEAKIVISAGRGLRGPENWPMIEELAQLLGGAVATSRPVSDMGWRPHSEHVGQTGKSISPKLYIAIGISGAIQHLAGVNGSETIVVINNDADAAFFKSADYGIVGDAFDVIPKLIDEIKKQRSL